LAILDFSASINPLGPPPTAIDAIQSHLKSLPHYPDPTYQTLRQALGNAHNLPPEWVLPGNGAAELLTWAGRELAALGATYIMTPAFGDYLRSLKAFSAKVIACPLPLEPSQAAIALPPLSRSPSPILPASAGLLLNNPHNPTGVLFPVSALHPLLEQFALVVVDEAFMDFLPPAQQQTLIDQVTNYPNLVILRSLTKFYSLPGLRLGYAIAHPDRLRRWQQWRDPWSVNVLAEAAAIAVLQDVPFQQQTWNWLATARPQLFDGLAALPGLQPFPSAANFLLVACQQSVKPLQRQLLTQHHILIRDCHSFPELGDRFFRVAIRTQAENQQLLAGLMDVV
jgi:L-threonine-O-3-phosphate decarboxylase